MQRVQRYKLSNVADNVNTINGVVDRNHPRWVFDEPLFAKTIKVSKIILPISYYSGIRKLSTNEVYFENPGQQRYYVTLTPAGFQDMNSVFSYLKRKFDEALDTASKTVEFEYNELSDRISLTLDDSTTAQWLLVVENYDLADILGVEWGTQCRFVGNRLFSYQFPGGQVTLAEQDSLTDNYLFPYSPNITGPNFLFLRSDTLAGSLENNYGVGSGGSRASNILASIDINQSFNTVQKTLLYDSNHLPLSTWRSGISSIDLYFTSESVRRNTPESEKVIDFNGQRWSVELEFTG